MGACIVVYGGIYFASVSFVHVFGGHKKEVYWGFCYYTFKSLHSCIKRSNILMLLIEYAFYDLGK